MHVPAQTSNSPTPHQPQRQLQSFEAGLQGLIFGTQAVKLCLLRGKQVGRAGLARQPFKQVDARQAAKIHQVADAPVGIFQQAVNALWRHVQPLGNCHYP